MIEGLKRERLLKDFGDSNSKVEVVYSESDPDTWYVRKRIRNLSSPLQQALFDKECLALSRLQYCDNVVQLIHAERGITPKGRDQEGWIILEFIAGNTLRAAAAEYKKWGDLYNLARQLIMSFSVIHSEGIIHRDINPSNIMITAGKVKIIDFGICKVLGEATKATTYRFATNFYAAPEVQYHSESASERSDIYSLGATLYYLFTKQDPPAPDAISHAIEIAGGIDANFKDILIKMTASDPAERYSDMFSVNEAMALLYDRYLKSDDFYRIVVPKSILSQLKIKALVQKSKSDNDLLREDLVENFSPTYASISEEDKNTFYVFDGRHYSFECQYDKDLCNFYVINLREPPDYMRAWHSQTYLEVNGTFTFSYSNNFVIQQNNTFNLMNRIHDFHRNNRSTKNIDRTFESKYGFWRNYIDNIIEQVKCEAPRFRYTSFSIHGNKVHFQLAEDSIFVEGLLLNGDFVITEISNSKKQPRAVRLGFFESYNIADRVIVVQRNGSRNTPPKHGTIIKDYESELSQFKKQRQALDSFIRQETFNSGNLKAIFTGLSTPTIFGNSKVNRFFDGRLDITQKEAVQKALSAKDIFLIQGPPGTGKTNVIVEIIRQMLKLNRMVEINYRKILVVAQAHSAVDKLLEDLDEFLCRVPTIRIGDIQNLSEIAKEKYGLDSLKAKWLAQSIQNAESKRNEILKSLGISQNDFASYMQAIECLNTVTSSTTDLDNARAIIDGFLNSYQLDSDSQVLNQLRISDGWIKQITEKEDIVDYFVKNATIIIGTCTGFLGGNIRTLFENTAFECVIIDEAAKATLPELMLSIIRSKKVILVGDHDQLPPVYDNRGLRTDTTKKVTIDQLKDGGFKQLHDLLPETSRQRLTTQYRMHPCIGTMISRIFYESTIQNGVSAKERSLGIDFLCNKAIVWVSTSSLEYNERKEDVCFIDGKRTFNNPLEVSVILQYLMKLDVAIGDRGHSVGIIASYRGQVELLKRDIASISLKNFIPEIDTVDGFQGNQRDIILYSPVRSSENSNIGFLSERPRLNVAFSRAKSLLIIVGDLVCLEKAQKADFGKVINYIREHEDDCSIIEYRKD